MKAKKTIKSISGGSTIHSYSPSTDERLKFAYVDLMEDYPESGYAVNQNQIEGIFVTEGTVQVTIDDKKLTCKAGDVVYFEEGQCYTVSGKGKIIVAIAPASGGKTEIVEKG